jgi:hypothetical protein
LPSEKQELRTQADMKTNISDPGREKDKRE